MSDGRGFPREVEAFREWLKENAPVLSQPFEDLLDAEVQHNPNSHILYALITSAFDAGRDYGRNGSASEGNEITRREPTSFRFSVEDILLLLYCLDATDIGANDDFQRQKAELKTKLEHLRKVLGGTVQ